MVKSTTTVKPPKQAKSPAGKSAAASPKPAVKSVSSITPKVVKPTLVTSANPGVTTAEFGKKDLIDQAVERSNVRKPDARAAIDAALELIGEALGRGEEMNLPPLGKIKINRSKEQVNADIYICKIRRKKDALG